jgi:hypothetical protein
MSIPTETKRSRRNVPHRLDQPLDLRSSCRFSHERAGEECAEHDRVARPFGDGREDEAQAEAGHQQRFRPLEARDPAHQVWDGNQADRDHK